MTRNLRGSENLRARLANISQQIVPAVHDELAKSAETVRTTVVADIRVQKLPAGAKREGGPGRRRHIPSPPFGPPNSDTGNLIGRYTSTSGSFSRTRIFSRVVAGVRYAKWLEFGTSRMLPRPHLLPRFREEGARLNARLRSVLNVVVATSRRRT